ncbi:hypothetical protein TWF481_011593 [Arthrobotrys musiformis]|uniref:Uncharacterized protein n=1 Tax=Arthrobotrys musiformis TaxID=47236 RepID=A0AAV9W0W0_9PEZI
MMDPESTVGEPPSTTHGDPPSTTDGGPPSTTDAAPPSTNDATSPSTSDATPPNTNDAAPPSTSDATPPSTGDADPPSTGHDAGSAIAAPVSTTLPVEEVIVEQLPDPLQQDNVITEAEPVSVPPEEDDEPNDEAPLPETDMLPKRIIYFDRRQIFYGEKPCDLRSRISYIEFSSYLCGVSREMKFHMKGVHLYREPGYTYASGETFRHRDYLGRAHEGPHSDRYLHHRTGGLRKLLISATEGVLHGPRTSTWRRTYVGSQADRKVRIANWIVDAHTNDNTGALPNKGYTFAGQCIGRKYYRTESTDERQFWSCGRLARRMFNGLYAPTPYDYNGQAKAWENKLENNEIERNAVVDKPEYRFLKPHRLWFLEEPHAEGELGARLWPVAQWESTIGRGKPLKYVFLSFNLDQFDLSNPVNVRSLHKIAQAGARSAGVDAYWFLMGGVQSLRELMFYAQQSFDVIRGSQKLVIALGQPVTAREGKQWSNEKLLRSWGKQIMTFPELLQSPSNTVYVYIRGKDFNTGQIISKSEVARCAWKDTYETQQLIGNYTGSPRLSRLDLATIAATCLYRQRANQCIFGQFAYISALTGLLRIRHSISAGDTSFQAFARLSFGHDSDRLLERCVCTLPLYPKQPWYDMRDAYGSSLADINPFCKVVGICDDDTVIIDGAFSASIRWKSFLSIDTTAGSPWPRRLAIKAMQYNGLAFLIACILSGLSSYLIAQPEPGAERFSPGRIALIAVGGIIFLYNFVIWLRTPKLIREAYGGMPTDIPPILFGVEGYLNNATIEKAIFGGSFGRFKWSTNGSPLCRSRVNQHGERVGVDPALEDQSIRDKIERAIYALPGEMRVFTLVDTYTMTVTLFEAVRPPVSLILCGEEGGMQRAIGCSYDWTTQTMYRETVLRVPTKCLSRMERISRFRFGTQREEWPSAPAKGTPRDSV